MNTKKKKHITNLKQNDKKGKYKIGLRTIKSGIAVFICVVSGVIFKRDNVFYSSIAAVICMQPTLDKTFKVGINRLIGTIIGGISGFFILELIFYLKKYSDLMHIIIIPVLIVILIYICNLIGKKDSSSICCIVFLSIVANYNREIPDVILYVINRVLDTSFGILVAMLINKFVFPHSDCNIVENSNENNVNKNIIK